MVLDLAVAKVKGVVVDEQADELAVGDIDDGLPGLGVAISSLGIGQRAQLVEGVQVGAGQAVRLTTLIKDAPKSDVPVGEGENGLALCEGLKVKSHLADAPLLDRENWLLNHCICLHSEPSKKTMARLPS